MANNSDKKEGTLLANPVSLHTVYRRQNITHIRFDGGLVGKSNSNVSFEDGAQVHARLIDGTKDKVLVTQKGGLFEVWGPVLESA
jgi:hypothetical protein